MVIIMTLWEGNGAVLKSSSQWQLKEVRKVNNSVHELFIYWDFKQITYCMGALKLF